VNRNEVTALQGAAESASIVQDAADLGAAVGSGGSFQTQAAAWDGYTSTPLGRLRTDLALHHLVRHAPPSESSQGLAVLDAGGGTGSYALPLVAQGYRVCLLDFSSEMLNVARRRSDGMAVSTGEGLETVLSPVQDVERLFPSDHFDIALCHTLLEYVESPADIIHQLAAVLVPGGLLSLLFVIPCADALRWALSRHDMQTALHALHSPSSKSDMFGLSRQVYSPCVVHQWLEDEGLAIEGEYGIRIFADHLPPEKLSNPEFYSALWQLEVEASDLDPLRQIGRYRQIIARRSQF